MAAKKRQWPWVTQKGRLVTIAVVAGAALLLAAGTIYYLVYVLKPAPQTAANNQFVAAINELLKQPVPDDPISKAIFYALVAQNYDNVGDPTTALTYYLKAQQIIDDNKLADQIVYYQPIADDYLAKKDVPQARKYLLLQKAHVQAYLQANPGDEPSEAALKELDRRLNELAER